MNKKEQMQKPKFDEEQESPSELSGELSEDLLDAHEREKFWREIENYENHRASREKPIIGTVLRRRSLL